MNNLIKCEICQEECKRIYGAHLKKHGITSKEYKLMFPNAKLMTDDDLTKTIKNSGKHMKTEKYKKMFSKMFSGEKNPNHMSRTTDEERKSRSPFSKNFIKYSGTEEEIKETISEFAKSAVKDRLTTVNLEYWIRKGYSEEDAKSMLKDRQTTFNLDKCIKKYGAEEGHKRWIERQSKWINSYKKINYSKISQELFIGIWEKLKDNFTNEIYFAKLEKPSNTIHDTNRNYEFRLNLDNGVVIPDFFIPSLKLVVEFDGTYYHRNTPENKNREERRSELLKSNGYKVVRVLEKEFVSYKEETINKIVNEINKIRKDNA